MSLSWWPHSLYYCCVPPVNPQWKIIFYQVFFLHLLILICMQLFLSARTYSRLWQLIFICMHIILSENLFLFMNICKNLFEPFLSVWPLTKFITIFYLHTHIFICENHFWSRIIHDHINNISLKKKVLFSEKYFAKPYNKSFMS